MADDDGAMGAAGDALGRQEWPDGIRALRAFVAGSEGPVIYACSSTYTTFMALVLLLSFGDRARSAVVMYSDSKNEIAVYERMRERLAGLGVRGYVVDKHTKLHRLVGLSDSDNYRVFRSCLDDLRADKYGYDLVNLSWNQQIVRYPSSIYYQFCRSSYFVEEGATVYLTPNDSLGYLLLKIFYGNQYGFWKDDKLVGMAVQRPQNYAPYLHEKMAKLDMARLAAGIADKTRGELADVCFDDEVRRSVRLLRDETDGVIFTQPLSEDGYVSEAEKIAIYDELMRYYARYGRVTLKLHPRDTSTYGVDAGRVANGSFPSEMTSFLGIRYKFAVGLCTSAIEGTDADVALNIAPNFLFDKKYAMIPLETVTRRKD